MRSRQMDRRVFLARLGVLGAVTGASTALPASVRGAAASSASDPLVDVVSKLLAELARDSLNGLSAFVVPGKDAYSRAQGTPRDEPGAMEARTPDFLIESLDNYVPLPDQLAKPVAAALANGLADVPIPLPGGLPTLPTGGAARLDDAIRLLLRNDETLPLSLVVALLLNTLATQVNPAAVNGLFLSPFSRLSFAEKASAFEMLEQTDSQFVAAIDRELPGPLKGVASGILRFLAGALLEFSAFGTYSEWSTFDPASLYVTKPPVGWRISGYDPGGMDGWDEFKGYYQGREKVSPR